MYTAGYKTSKGGKEPMKRVVAYCRVSTDNDDQVNSLESQKRYFGQYIKNSADWELVEIYADEGISGTSTKKRKAFNKMIGDAELKLFDMIITKEISRFARNTLDSIFYTRKLKELGIGVFFMNDNINTLDADSELRLTIMSSIAQEESRKTSERVKWGQKRRMEDGVVFGRNILGYDLKGGILTVNEVEADIVRLIFSKYLDEGKGTHIIAKELRDAEILTKNGSVEWSNTVLHRILQNEKYAGDLKQKKTLTPNYLTHEKKYNHGEEDFVVIENHHEAIIDRDTFNRVQEEVKHRRTYKLENAKYSGRHTFSGKVKCGICNSTYVSRKRKRNDGTQRHLWQCFSNSKYGAPHKIPNGEVVGCNGKSVNNDILEAVFINVLNDILSNKDSIMTKAIDTVTSILDEQPQNYDVDIIQIEKEIQKLKNQKHKLVDLYFANNITKDDLKEIGDKYERQIEKLSEKLHTIKNQVQQVSDKDSILNSIIDTIKSIVNCNTFSDEVCRQLLDRVIVKGKTEFDFYIKGRLNSINFFLNKDTISGFNLVHLLRNVYSCENRLNTRRMSNEAIDKYRNIVVNVYLVL